MSKFVHLKALNLSPPWDLWPDLCTDKQEQSGAKRTPLQNWPYLFSLTTSELVDMCHCVTLVVLLPLLILGIFALFVWFCTFAVFATGWPSPNVSKQPILGVTLSQWFTGSLHLIMDIPTHFAPYFSLFWYCVFWRVSNITISYSSNRQSGTRLS